MPIRDNDFEVGQVVPRMLPCHWTVLGHVARFGMFGPTTDSEISDLKAWGLVEEYDNSGIVMTTDLGDLVLDEEPPLDG